MKVLAVPSILILLILSGVINLLQYEHAQRLQEEMFISAHDVRTFHYLLDQEEEQVRDMTQEVMAVADIDNYLKAEHYAKSYIEAARRYDLDPRLLLFLTLIESRFDPHALSNKGAVGMTQVMPKVWLKRIDFVTDHKDLMDPYLSIHAGAHVLRHYLNRANGNLKLALLMYNRGERAVNKDILKGRDPSNGFARKILFSHEGEARLDSSPVKSNNSAQAGSGNSARSG